MSTVRRKSDQHLFIQHINLLTASPVGDARDWWSRFVYHFTDIVNAVEILQCDALLSREAAQNSGLMKNDNASASVIQLRKDTTMQYVRLYFGPKTPTQYNNEGFRPVNNRSIESHCPVPVYFLLDSKEVLTREQTLFSEGNLAKGAALMTSGQDFMKLPFAKIFHRHGVGPDDRDEIVYHRHAEVVVPHRLELSADIVKFILCRSPAEQATLLYWLDDRARAKWGPLIGTRPKAQLFNGRWTYVDNAVLADNAVQINFNPNSTTPGPFRLLAIVRDRITGREFTLEEASFYSSKEPLEIDLSELNLPAYDLEIYLDGHIAFADSYTGDDIPF
jgi:hypothetical protein